jgi:hypothetical protein
VELSTWIVDQLGAADGNEQGLQYIARLSRHRSAACESPNQMTRKASVNSASGCRLTLSRAVLEDLRRFFATSRTGYVVFIRPTKSLNFMSGSLDIADLETVTCARFADVTWTAAKRESALCQCDLSDKKLS